jgi:membrane fusion protein (multidrug efflux system)
MKPRLLVVLIALAGLGALGWYAYTQQRLPGLTGFEIQSKAGADKSAPPGGAAGGAATGAPGGAPPRAGEAGAGKGPPGPGGRPGGPATVEVAKVVSAALREEVVAAGTLRANEIVTLRSEVAGRVVRVGFTDGARVAGGTVLIALDRSVLEAELQQVRAELALARSNFERTSELASRNFVSQSARDQAAANLKVIEARVQLAEARLAKLDVRAPFEGVMGLRNISPGDFIKDGNDLAVIEDIKTMKVDLRLPERYFGRVKPGQSVSITVDSLPDKTFTARLKAIDTQVDANGRSLLARGELGNPGGALRTGMFAKARVVLRDSPSALLIPEEAIVPMGQESFVYRIEEGKANRVPVKVGLRQDGRVEVVSGLKEGDTVVTAGQLRLQRDGQDVRIIDPNRRPPGAGKGDASPKEGASKEGASKDAASKDGAQKDGASKSAAPKSDEAPKAAAPKAQ